VSCSVGAFERLFMQINNTINSITKDDYDYLSDEEARKIKLEFIVSVKKKFFLNTVAKFYEVHLKGGLDDYENIDDLIKAVIPYISDAINTCTWDVNLIDYKDKREDWREDWSIWIDKYNLCDDAILYYELMLDDSVLSAPGYKLPLDRPEHLETQNEYLNTLLQDIDEFVEINAAADAQHMANEHPNNGNGNNGNEDNGNGANQEVNNRS
jgi:hypothetical protein